MKFIKNLLLLIIGIALGVAGSFYFDYDIFLKDKTTDSQTLLKSIKQVTKMVTVEAKYENVLNHKDFIKYDFYPFRKKAILKVKATVAAGCDLEKLNFEINEASKTMTILNFPKSEILSIETDVEYYNMQEGFFNNFSEKELTNLNFKAKEDVRIEAYKSDLLQKADLRAEEMLSIITLLAKTSGYKVILKQSKKQFSEVDLLEEIDN